VGEELFQHGANLGHIHGGDLPDNVQIHVGIVMGDNVAHTAHFSKGELRNGLAGRLGQVRRGFADDFDAPYHGILFFLVGVEVSLGGSLTYER